MTAVWQANSFKLFFNLLTKNGWALEAQKRGYGGGIAPSVERGYEGGRGLPGCRPKCEQLNLEPQ